MEGTNMGGGTTTEKFSVVAHLQNESLEFFLMLRYHFLLK